jgi:hypothetical protein
MADAPGRPHGAYTRCFGPFPAFPLSMTGLLRRIRRPGAADESRTDETPLSDPAAAPVDSPPAGGAPVAALPAGVDPEEIARRPNTRRRGSLRRRLRYLQRVREVMLRDLGGLVYEIRRREPGAAEALVDAKVQRLAAVDAELRELEEALGPRGETVLREPGIGGSCPACGELHPSDARFCAGCGSALPPQAAPPAAEEPAPGPAPTAAVVEPAPELPSTAASEAPTHEQAGPSNGRPDGAPTSSEPASASTTDRA